MQMENVESMGSASSIKNHLMTLGIFKSGSGETDNMAMMVVGMILVTLIESFVKLVPVIIKKIEVLVTRYMASKVNSTMDLMPDFNKEKVASAISFEKSYTDASVVDSADAILDMACKQDTALKLKFRTRFYIANQEEFKVANGILMQLQEIKRDDKGEITSIEFKVFSEGMSLSQLRKWVNDVTTRYKEEKRNELGSNRYFFDEMPINVPQDIDGSYRLSMAPKNLTFTMTRFETTKSLENLYGSHVEKIRKRVYHFLKNPEWFERNGVPYTLGILLYGKPGCGKTSLIKAIAKDTKRHIVNLQLRKTTTKSQMKQLFYNSNLTVCDSGSSSNYYIPTDERIYVLEDVDCLTDILHQRKKELDTTESDEETNEFDDSLKQTNESDNSLKQTNDEPMYNQGGQVGSQMGSHPPIFYDSASAFEPMSGMGVGGMDGGFGEYASINSFPMNASSSRGFDTPNNMDNISRAGSVVSKSSKSSKKSKNAPEDSEKINLSFILNIIDGILETPGRILIMTSNFPDKLDTALTRPGRIDLKIEFTPCDTKMIRDMFHSFYQLENLGQYNFENCIPSEKNKDLRPCELQEILNENYDNPDNAYQSICDWFSVEKTF